jgi:hypothetical protein
MRAKPILLALLAVTVAAIGAVVVAEKTSHYVVSDQVNAAAPVQTQQTIRINAPPRQSVGTANRREPLGRLAKGHRQPPHVWRVSGREQLRLGKRGPAHPLHGGRSRVTEAHRLVWPGVWLVRHPQLDLDRTRWHHRSAGAREHGRLAGQPRNPGFSKRSAHLDCVLAERVEAVGRAHLNGLAMRDDSLLLLFL